MTVVEGIVGLIASVIAILGGLAFLGRYLGKKFDSWIDVTVENSKAVKTLTNRVIRLEIALRIPPDGEHTDH